MAANMAKLYAKVEDFCKNPRSLDRSLMQKLYRALFDEEFSQNRNRLTQMIGALRRASRTDDERWADYLSMMGRDAYSEGDTNFAEFLYRESCDLYEDMVHYNNLAYILRRRTMNYMNMDEIISLLLPGVKRSEAFCMTNMGLLFSIGLGTEEDWRIADSLFSLLPDDMKTRSVMNWWEKLGRQGETEGYLVHFFLLRHKKIVTSNLGSVRSLAYRIMKDLKNYPDWLAEEYAVKSFDDALQCKEDPNFIEMLENYLKDLECSRENADVMLEVLSSYDLKPVYHKLLRGCREVLTAEETARLKTDYKLKFSTEFSDTTT